MKKAILTFVTAFATVCAYSMPMDIASDNVVSGTDTGDGDATDNCIQLADEGRVWEVVDRNMTSVTVKRYAFRGTETVNDKVYNRFCLISEVNGQIFMDMPQDDPEYQKLKDVILINSNGFTEKEEPEPVCLIRQEGGKIYIADDKTSFLSGYPKSEYPQYYRFTGNEHEYLTFDFQTSKGEKWNILQVGGMECLADAEVIRSDESVSIEGVECRKLEIATTPVPEEKDKISFESLKHIIVEGIGVVRTEAHVIIPVYLNSSFSFPASDTETFLNNVYNSKGDVIYKAVGFRLETSSVKDIHAENPLRIYQNEGVLFAETEGNKEISLRIYSADGSVVVSKTGNGNVEYPLTGLQKGVYIVRAVAGNSAGKTIRVMI